MKSHEEILNKKIEENVGDFDSPWYQDGSYDGRDYEIIVAMNLAAEQAFNSARLEIETIPENIEDWDRYYKSKYKTFKDYLKELNNED